MKIDTTEFDRTMLEYIKHSKKSIPEALNQKAYWVAKGAIKATRVANKDKITGFVKDWKKSGAAIIKSFNLETDRSGSWTRKEVQKRMRQARHKSIGYLRSGWLPTLRATGGWCRPKQKRTFKGVRQKGRKKGSVRIARKVWDSVVTMTNTTGYTKRQEAAARRFVRPALQLAITREATSMKVYSERKQREALGRAGAGSNIR